MVLWDVATGKRMLTLGDDYDTVLAADIRPDQAQVALGGPSRLVKLWSTKTGQLQHKIKKHTDWVTAVAFSPNGQMLATADRNGGISVWDPDSAQELFTLAGHKVRRHRPKLARRLQAPRLLQRGRHGQALGNAGRPADEELDRARPRARCA